MFAAVARRCACGLAGALIVMGIAACGASSGGGEAAKSPRQVLADATAALKRLNSFRLNGSVTDSQGIESFRVAVAGAGRLQAVLRRASGTVEFVVLGGEVYLNATRGYWTSEDRMTSAQAAILADRWLKLPLSDNQGFEAAVRITGLPGVFAKCWEGWEARTGARSASSTVVGKGSVNRRAAVILSNNGSQPGSAPGRMYVAASGPAWPERIAQPTGANVSHVVARRARG
jgi:hypothetical protein